MKPIVRQHIREEFKLTGPSWEETLEAIKDMDPDDILERGIKFESEEAIEYAIEHGADITNVPKMFYKLFEQKDFEFLKYLLDSSKDVQRAYNIALIYACKTKELDSIEFLLNFGADVHALNDSPLHIAIDYNNDDLVKLLLDNGADVHASKDLALRLAKHKRHTRILNILQNYIAKEKVNENFKLSGPSWNETLEAIKDMTPNTILIRGAKYGSLKLIKYALNKGANVHAVNDIALRWASIRGYADIVKYLLDHGANVYVEGGYPLQWAKYENHIKTVKVIKDHIKKLQKNKNK